MADRQLVCLGGKSLRQFLRPFNYTLFDLLIDAREQLLGRSRKEDLAGKRGLQLHGLRSPFVSRDACRIDAHEKRYLGLRQVGAFSEAAKVTRERLRHERYPWATRHMAVSHHQGTDELSKT